jgi:hypothetical protein
MAFPGMGAAVSAAAQAVVQGSKQLATEAAEGRFAISEEGGRALLEAIREMRSWIEGQGHRLTLLAQEPQLGGSHGAQTMKPFVQQVASDQEGFITMLQAFGTSLDAAEQGINDAIGNYHRIDAEHTTPFAGKG